MTWDNSAISDTGMPTTFAPTENTAPVSLATRIEFCNLDTSHFC